MAPRIIESDDEFDELASTSDDGSTHPSSAKLSTRQPAAGVSRTSTRTVKVAPIAAQAQKQQLHPRQQPPSRPAARQAAIRANESMDVDGAIASDEDAEEDDEQDELADKDDEDAEEDQDDAEGEDEDEYEDNASTPGVGAGGYARPSPSTSNTSGIIPVRIKLKLGGNRSTGASSSPALPRTVISLRGKGKAARRGGAGGKRGRGKATAQASIISKRKRPDNDEFGNEEEDEQPDAQNEEEEEDFLSDESGDSNMSTSKMTARQRAAHIGAEPELLTLPEAPSKKKIFTEDEVAMRKVETSRRRKHLLNKKLEEEKQETIERLLKKPIGRRGGASTSRIAAATKVDRSSTALVLPIMGGVAEDGQVIAPSELALHVQATLPTLFRWISSTKDGDYKEIWGVPIGSEEQFQWPVTAGPKVKEMDGLTSGVIYPPPRPPPRTRLLEKVAAIAA
ncbi:MAG: hypothetical protein CYPHOPRED_003561 [Cyphobasidiales sp. Tagirdzhanova-0007]|nr:MAG: hypothetical protein CYPHOPRED_003561 [Cyphobasidiales sp. Tagirdzhanova-0007]